MPLTSSIGSNVMGKSKKELQQIAALKVLAVQEYNLCNQERIKAGLKELTWNGQLEADASVRAEEVSAEWSHTRPNGYAWYTLDDKNMYGENLAKGYANAQDCVEAWMESPEHKENILYPFTTTGIVVRQASDGTIYSVQEFGY
jgi:uncharacterized protein YkwD